MTKCRLFCRNSVDCFGKSDYLCIYFSLKKLIILILIIDVVYMYVEKFKKLDLSNEIIIKIKGKGSQNILYSDFPNKPDKIIIGEISYIINKYNNNEME